MWFDKECDNAVFVDCRAGDFPLCDGRVYRVHPDVVADFRALPFPDASFRLVLFDPPHLVRGGDRSWLVQKYGRLDQDSWRDDLARGFAECWRVLAPGGTLVFKWSEVQVAFREVKPLLPCKPLFGSRIRGALFIVMFKEG